MELCGSCYSSQGARRGLTEGCGGELRVDFLSGTPSTYHCYHHSHLTDPGIIGTKASCKHAIHTTDVVLWCAGVFLEGPVQRW